MHPSQSRQSFWNLKEASDIIAHGIKYSDPSWQPTPRVPLWKQLRQQILSSYCIGKLPLESDDDVRTFLRFRCLLGTVADLLFLFRGKIDKWYGWNAWQKASVYFEHSVKRQILFRFLGEISLADRPSAINYLEAVARQGLCFQLPGGVPSCFWSKDGGFQAMVGITEMILDFLPHEIGAVEKPNERTPDNTPRLKKSAQIWLDTYSKRRLRLTAHGREPIEFADKVSTLITTLMREGSTASDEKLCETLWPAKNPGNWEQGALNSLKTLVGLANAKLSKSWGKPYNKKPWIDRIENDAYFLNDSVRWAYRTQKNFKRNASRSMDPAKMDRLNEKTDR